MPYPPLRQSTRILGGVVSACLILLGIAEFVTRLGDPWPLLFWLPTLWGGGVLVLAGVFGFRDRPRVALGLVVVGALLGFLPTVWTLAVPALSVALVVRMVRESGRPVVGSTTA